MQPYEADRFFRKFIESIVQYLAEYLTQILLDNKFMPRLREHGKEKLNGASTFVTNVNLSWKSVDWGSKENFMLATSTTQIPCEHTELFSLVKKNQVNGRVDEGALWQSQKKEMWGQKL